MYRYTTVLYIPCILPKGSCTLVLHIWTALCQLLSCSSSYRYFQYTEEKFQYFMLDFCYFMNLSVAVQTGLYPNCLPWYKVQLNYRKYLPVQYIPAHIFSTKLLTYAEQMAKIVVMAREVTFISLNIFTCRPTTCCQWASWCWLLWCGRTASSSTAWTSSPPSSSTPCPASPFTYTGTSQLLRLRRSIQVIYLPSSAWPDLGLHLGIPRPQQVPVHQNCTA